MPRIEAVVRCPNAGYADADKNVGRRGNCRVFTRSARDCMVRGPAPLPKVKHCDIQDQIDNEPRRQEGARFQKKTVKFVKQLRNE